MAPVKLPELPPECPDGGHSPYPHDHSWHPVTKNPKDRCSGSFWCTRCKRWFTGSKCKLVPVGKAA
jgi:hypothetical protein